MTTTISKIFLLFIFFASIEASVSSVVVNEIMPAPLDGEPEWIELYNLEDRAINYLNTSISDLATNRKLPDFTIPANGYAIIVKDTSLLKTYHKIPLEATLVQATIPALNNTTDAVVFRDSNGNIIDSTYYDLKWGEKGLSLERISVTSLATSQDNWGASADPSGATPGAINSIAIINYDISCASLSLTSDFDKIEIHVKNVGKQKIETFNFELLAKFSGTNSELIEVIINSAENLHFSESDTLITLPIDLVKSKMNRNEYVELTSIITSISDQRRINDTARVSVYLMSQEPIIKINEIMYDVSSDFAEYIEIWNGGNDTLLMDNFVIWDAAGSLTKGNIKVISDKFKIAPDAYGVITWDSSFFDKFDNLIGKENVYFMKSSLNLNLSGDLIVLADASGKIYDSLTYSNLWHSLSAKDTKNRSLEKINPNLESQYPDNWTTCSATEGGTPGSINSVTGISSLEGSLSINPNPFAPSSAGSESNAIINYELPYLRSYISAYIYDTSGFMVAQLSNNRYSGAIGSLVWDGRNSEGYIAQVGQYVLLIESTDIDSGAVIQQKALIVIGN